MTARPSTASTCRAARTIKQCRPGASRLIVPLYLCAIVPSGLFISTFVQLQSLSLHPIVPGDQIAGRDASGHSPVRVRGKRKWIIITNRITVNTKLWPGGSRELARMHDEAPAAWSQTRPRAVTGRHHKSRKGIVLSFFRNHNLVCVVGQQRAYAYSTQRLIDLLQLSQYTMQSEYKPDVVADRKLDMVRAAVVASRRPSVRHLTRFLLIRARVSIS
jgi:hypothetical protein